jgi:23S rRNA-/tRNA-specific pseudouridylate synthase
MPQRPVDILYEEGPCLAVSKPAGLLTQAPPGIDSLELRVKSFLKRRDNRLGNIYLGVPHRLDRPVSGVVLLARHVRAARRLAEQFEGRLVGKTYWAIVEGWVEPDQATWTDYLRKIPDQPRAEVVAANHPNGKLAILHYRVLVRDGPSAGDDRPGMARAEGGRTGQRGAGTPRSAGGPLAPVTMLEITLETGRTHQIRVQSAARGHSVLGDHQYRGERSFGPETDDWRQRAIALHARRIDFRHPMTRERVSIEANLPDFWPTFGPECPSCIPW